MTPPIQIYLISLLISPHFYCHCLSFGQRQPLLRHCWLIFLSAALSSFPVSPHPSTVVFLMCRSVQDTPFYSAEASVARRIKFRLSNETAGDPLDLPPLNSQLPLSTSPQSSHPHSFSALREIVRDFQLLTRSRSPPSFVHDIPLAGDMQISRGELQLLFQIFAPPESFPEPQVYTKWSFKVVS